MSLLKGAALDGFLRRPPGAYQAALIYGPDAGKVRDSATLILSRLGIAPDDSFALVTLSEAELHRDPARLVDEAGAQSLFGGVRVVLVSDAGTHFAAAMDLLDSARPGNFILAQGGDLPKTSKLRQAFEKASEWAAIACYEDSAHERAHYIETLLERAHLEPTAEALQTLKHRLGGSRDIVRQEVEKLYLYLGERTRFDADDVEAIVCSQDDSAADALADLVLAGALNEVDAAFGAWLYEGNNAAGALSVVIAALCRLAELSDEVSHGKTVDAVLKSARPPIFFKRHAAVARQIRTWERTDIDKALHMMNEATRASRGARDLSSDIIARAMLGVARLARAQQQR